MAYVTKYILPFNNDLDEVYEINFEYSTDSGTATGDPIFLIGAEKVLTESCTAGDEDVLASILASNITINIFVDQSSPITITDFIAVSDNQIRITIYKDKDYSKVYWQGFIAVEDNNQPLLDPPFILSVNAVDGLGLLKKVDLVDTTGLLLVGRFSVIEWLGNILYKTDQTLNIRTYFPFYNSDPLFHQDLDVLSQIYIDSITFIKGDVFNANSTNPSVDLSALAGDDAYTCLEKICRNLRCRLFQEDGVWHFKSIYDHLNPNQITYFEYQLNDPIEGLIYPTFSELLSNGIKYDVNVGKGEIIIPVNDDAILYLKQQTKYVELDYTYDQSLNKVCNQDFTDLVVDLPNLSYSENINSQLIDTSGNTYNGRTSSGSPIFYDMPTQGYGSSGPYCWDHKAISAGAVVAPTGNAFVRVVFDAKRYEYSRFMVLDLINDGSAAAFLKSSEFLLDGGDTINISVDVAIREHIAGHPFGLQSISPMALIMDGDDGNTYAFTGDEVVTDNHSVPAKWVRISDPTNPEYLFNTSYNISGTFDDSQGQQWTTITAGNLTPYSPCPINGRLHLYLLQPVTFGVPNTEVWFKNISITIKPFFNGSYAQLKGDYNYSGSKQNIKLSQKDDVQISDSPKRYFKGALIKPNGDLWPPTWFRAGVTESKRFTELMGKIIYTFRSRMVHKIEGTFLGSVYINISDGKPHPNGLLCNYYFVDSDAPTRRYMLTSYDKDISTGTWRGVFVETLTNANQIDLALPDTYKFSYLFS